jgi:hypothetical protein
MNNIMPYGWNLQRHCFCADSMEETVPALAVFWLLQKRENSLLTIEVLKFQPNIVE